MESLKVGEKSLGKWQSFDEYLKVPQNLNTLNFIDLKESFPTKELSRQVEKVVLQRWRGASSCEQKKQDTAADQTEP